MSTWELLKELSLQYDDEQIERMFPKVSGYTRPQDGIFEQYTEKEFRSIMLDKTGQEE